jgi:hypothetical protein
VSKDRATHQILSDYADFNEADDPEFKRAFREHVRKTFEGDARKAMKKYKAAIVLIPDDTKIDPSLLNGLTEAEFIQAFKALQKFIWGIYDAIGKGAPFEWGWPDWKGITSEGINHNRVMETLHSLADATVKPPPKMKQITDKIDAMGLYDIPNVKPVLRAYFSKGNDAFRLLSYRFVEDPTAQSRETYFLAKTDGEPENRRTIYYWLYDEALKHGFTPKGRDHMGCYLYEKGRRSWLLLGGGHSYHEDAFLHTPPYAMAAKVNYYRVFAEYPEKMTAIMKRFPSSFGRPWTQCYNCRADSRNCQYRVNFPLVRKYYYHCGRHHSLFFHDPGFEDVKAILELYMLEWMRK